MFGREHHNRERHEHHHGDGLGEEVKVAEASIAMNTEPCELQLKMYENPIGRKFLGLFDHLCKNGTDPDILNMVFGDTNFNADMVNSGVRDHLYAITVLENMEPKEREKLYELVEKYIDAENVLNGNIFKFDTQHNIFQEMYRQQQQFNDLLSFNFDGMMMQNLTYNAPRLSIGFSKNLLVGAHFDNITNIKLQSYRGFDITKENPDFGFYIYVGQDDKNIQTYFINCEHESGKLFKITKVTSQDGALSWLGFASGEIPKRDDHGSYFQGLKDEFEVDGKKIFIDKDPFSDKDGEKIELEKEKEPRPSKSNDVTEPELTGSVTDETGPETDNSETVTDEEDSNKNDENIVGGKRKTKKRKNKTKKRKTKQRKVVKNVIPEKELQERKIDFIYYNK